MLASGFDAIAITLCDPKPEGAEALALAIDSLREHDRYLGSHPQFFVRPTSANDITRAQQAGTLAVFYLYQNTVQVDKFIGTTTKGFLIIFGLATCQRGAGLRHRVGLGVPVRVLTTVSRNSVFPGGGAVSEANERARLIRLHE